MFPVPLKNEMSLNIRPINNGFIVSCVSQESEEYIDEEYFANDADEVFAFVDDIFQEHGY